MKREDLKKLLGDAATDEVIDKIMTENGKDIESHKQKVATAEGQVGTLTTQLEDANKQVAEFKNMDVDKIKQTATEWESKAQEAEKLRKEEVEALKLQHAVEKELKEIHKVIDPVDLLPRLKMDVIRLDGEKLIGLTEQVEPLKTSKAYLFSSDNNNDNNNDDETTPKLVKGQNKTKPTPKDKQTLAEAIGQRMGITPAK